MSEMERDEDCCMLFPFPESLNPLTDSKGRVKGEEKEESGSGHSNMALIISRDAFTSRRRGREPGDSCNGKVPAPAPRLILISTWRTSRVGCADMKAEGARDDAQRRFVRMSEVRFAQRLYSKNSSAKGRMRKDVP